MSGGLYTHGDGIGFNLGGKRTHWGIKTYWRAQEGSLQAPAHRLFVDSYSAVASAFWRAHSFCTVSFRPVLHFGTAITWDQGINFQTLPAISKHRVAEKGIALNKRQGEGREAGRQGQAGQNYIKALLYQIKPNFLNSS